jgi:hypothetical protein
MTAPAVPAATSAAARPPSVARFTSAVTTCCLPCGERCRHDRRPRPRARSRVCATSRSARQITLPGTTSPLS